MFQKIFFAACLLTVTVAGCDANEYDSAVSTSNEVALGSPWENVDAIGEVSSQLGPTLRISSTKGTLFSILETVANHYSVAISVEPSHLLDRPITVELEGENAESVLNVLAKQSGLELSKLSDNKWQLAYPSLRDGKPETVMPSDF